MGQERANLILMFSRCLNSLMVRACGGGSPKPTELVKNGGPYRARPNLIINLGRKTPFLQMTGLGRTMLSDFGRGANRMGSRLLNDS